MAQDRDLRTKLKKLKLLAFDVDGTLTDGRLYIGSEGETVKVFNGRDGMGLVLAGRAGLLRGFVTGRVSAPVVRRAKELNLDFCRDGVIDKVTALGEILATYGLTWEEAGFMGDDLNDLGVLEAVGVAAAPADSCAEVLERADWVSAHDGGRGAVREWIETVLVAQDKWDGIVAMAAGRSAGGVC